MSVERENTLWLVRIIIHNRPGTCIKKKVNRFFWFHVDLSCRCTVWESDCMLESEMLLFSLLYSSDRERIHLCSALLIKNDSDAYGLCGKDCLSDLLRWKATVMGLPTHHFMFLILRSTDKKHHGSLNMRFSSESKTRKLLHQEFWNS